MFSTAFTLAASLSILSLTSANPLAPRTNLCRPNFQSLAVSAFGYYDDKRSASRSGMPPPRRGAMSFSGQLAGRPSRRHRWPEMVTSSSRNPAMELKNSASNAKTVVRTASSMRTIARSRTPRPGCVSPGRPWTRVRSSR
ncbi:hypothetical protein BD779DRAFT_278039 [Infundibulicybe gibba]|nr:hypothetical protein BD779DRAFT_278039 [Infundibulicybe gibba]